jgi:mannosylglycerate hydrolase
MILMKFLKLLKENQYNMDNKKNYDMNIIINTHWDREYRWSFVETQFRLAEAVDDLIDVMNKEDKFAFYHTDSQSSMLDDYLDIRPERTQALKKLVKEGRILTGPWYTLPAEFLVSGEALVRNLLLGHQIAQDLGKVMKVAYNIFSWGQVSQLPQIYKQFGMDTIIFYRGIDQSAMDNLEFIWKAPDGTEALGITFGSYHRLNFWRYVYMPYILGNQDTKVNGHCIGRNDLGDDGYLFNLCDSKSDDINHKVIDQPCSRNIEGALAGMEQLVKTVEAKSSVDDLLFLQGFDQENPDPIIIELVEKINENIDYGQLKVASLPEYIKTIKEKLIQKNILETLQIREGEMLEVEKVGDAFGPLYNGVFSARMPLKMLNASCQYGLEYWAEPTAVWNMLLNHTYPTIPLKRAWKEILKNQQHDGIGGCHVDRVTKTMIERYDNVKDIAETVTRDALRELTCRIDFSQLQEKEIGLVVFNSTQFERTEIVTITVDIPMDWSVRNVGGKYLRDFSINMKNHLGQVVDTQTLNFEEDTVFGYLKYGNVISFESTRVRLAFEAENVPGNGYTTYTLSPSQALKRPIERISTESNIMENNNLRVQICANGSISITNKMTGSSYKKLNYFEDAGEKGGPLIFNSLNEQEVYTTLSASPEIALIYNGPLMAQYRITYEWQLPVGLETQLKVHVPHGSEWVEQGRLQRSKQKKIVKIQSDVILRKNSNSVEFATEIDNTVADHRLRVMFPTQFSDLTQYITDSPYDIVTRTIEVPDSTGWYESAAVTWPSQSFISLNKDKEHFTVIHQGIPEYEVTDNCSRTVALTLLRGFGTAGNPTETYRYQELAQCLGKHQFNYEICLEEGNVSSPAQRLSKAIGFNVPMRVAQTTKHSGQLGAQNSFIKISDDRFIVTAIKKAEYEDAIIVRGYNASDVVIDLTIEMTTAIRKAQIVTLEEKVVSDCQLTDSRSIQSKVGHKEIKSFMIITY